jgi:uncharacterized protein (TIGR02271 family)
MNSNEKNNYNRLQELGGSDYKIAEGEDNIKGWDVKDMQDNDLGDVDELIFDVESLKVRYLVLDLDKNKDLGLENRKVLIPIGMAELDHEDDEVILKNISIDQIRALPDYDKDNLNSDYEQRNYSSLAGAGAAAATTADFYNNDNFNDRNLYRNRRRDRVVDETDTDDSSNFNRRDDIRDTRDDVHDTRNNIRNTEDDIRRDTRDDIHNTRNNIHDTEDDIRRDTRDDIRHTRDNIRDTGDDIRRHTRDDIKDRDRNTNDTTSIPVIEEELNVGKKEVERGGIRITSRVVEKPVEKNINLREEHITVERQPVNRAATESDFEQAKDQDIEVREHAEVPVVNKEARVVEEIKLKKDVTEHEETINDTVRKTEVKVDDSNRNKRDYTDENA